MSTNAEGRTSPAVKATRRTMGVLGTHDRAEDDGVSRSVGAHVPTVRDIASPNEGEYDTM